MNKFKWGIRVYLEWTVRLPICNLLIDIFSKSTHQNLFLYLILNLHFYIKGKLLSKCLLLLLQCINTDKRFIHNEVMEIRNMIVCLIIKHRIPVDIFFPTQAQLIENIIWQLLYLHLFYSYHIWYFFTLIISNNKHEIDIDFYYITAQGVGKPKSKQVTGFCVTTLGHLHNGACVSVVIISYSL